MSQSRILGDLDLNLHFHHESTVRNLVILTYLIRIAVRKWKKGKLYSHTDLSSNWGEKGEYKEMQIHGT